MQIYFYFSILFLLYLKSQAVTDGSGDEDSFDVAAEEFISYSENTSNKHITKKIAINENQMKEKHESRNVTDEIFHSDSVQKIYCEQMMCDQLCNFKNGLIFCDCHSGYRLDADQRSCLAVCDPDCLNGGHCIASNVCQCPAHYFGKQCQTIRCVPSCENRGTCLHVNRCLCPHGFFGARCQHVLLKECSPPCQNGGTCIKPGQCRCTIDYIGSFCGQAKGQKCRPQCQNGGKCLHENHCECPIGTSGYRCQNRRCPVITFAEKIIRSVRMPVKETYLGSCGKFGWKKCVQYRTTQKLVQRTMYKVGYKISCG